MEVESVEKSNPVETSICNPRCELCKWLCGEPACII